MGLSEYLSSNVSLVRNTVSFTVDPSLIGSINLGSAYALLKIQTDLPCRFRLYDSVSSRNDANESSRLFSTTNTNPSIALTGDFSMSVAGVYTIDPVLYGVISNPTSNLSYYRVNGTFSSTYPTITLTIFTLEDSSISIDNRRTIEYITGSLNPGALVSGIKSDDSVPRTYLLVSASLTNPSAKARLRLYSTTGSLSVVSEVSRSFATESMAKDLIVDMIITGSQPVYFSPKIVGANLQTIDYTSPELGKLRQSPILLAGESSLYYVLQNVDSSGPTNISASLHVFSLEE
jgi:hypothetical protein